MRHGRGYFSRYLVKQITRIFTVFGWIVRQPVQQLADLALTPDRPCLHICTVIGDHINQGMTIFSELVRCHLTLALLVLKMIIRQPTRAAHLHLHPQEYVMTSDSGVVGGLLLIAALLFIGFFFIEVLPIIGS